MRITTQRNPHIYKFIIPLINSKINAYRVNYGTSPFAFELNRTFLRIKWLKCDLNYVVSLTVRVFSSIKLNL